MKLTHAFGCIALSSCLAAGCASTGPTQLAGAAPARTSSGGLSSVASSAGRNLADEHVGSALMGGAMRDDARINEAASYHEPQFAGPTPQVPIPHDGHQGNPANW